MKFADYKNLSKAELKKKLKVGTTELFSLKMKNSLGQLANPMEIRKLRKEIARLNTIVSHKSE